MVMAAMWAAKALATDEEETVGPCSTSMPPMVSETMEILSEPHVQQILEFNLCEPSSWLRQRKLDPVVK